MPCDYYCRSCRLAFTVGWFHFHQYEDFAAATMLVCRRCGTCHRIDHAVGGKQPDTLSARPGPLHWSPERSDDRFLRSPEMREFLGDGIEFDVGGFVLGAGGWTDYPVSSELRPERREPAYPYIEGCTDRLALDDVACYHCGATGALTGDWPEGSAACPSCGAETLECTSCWMT